MRKLTVFNSLTLDGVMQAPGDPDEDRRDNFEFGGWALPYHDAVMASKAADGMGEQPDLLLGRRTYESFYAAWAGRDDNPYSAALTAATKYVPSRTLAEPLPWENTVLLPGDARKTVALLKAEEGNDLLLMGSGHLLQSLVPSGLVDTYVLLIHPLTLGTGRRMFVEGMQSSLELQDVQPTTTGVVMATYSRKD